METLFDFKNYEMLDRVITLVRRNSKPWIDAFLRKARLEKIRAVDLLRKEKGEKYNCIDYDCARHSFLFHPSFDEKIINLFVRSFSRFLRFDGMQKRTSGKVIS